MNVKAGGVYIYNFLRFVDRASRHINLKKNQLDAQFISSIFRQISLHVSVISIAHQQDVHRMDTAVGTYCCIHTVYLLMIGYRYARNM